MTNTKTRLLVVDDEVAIRDSLTLVLGTACEVEAVDSVASAKARLKNSDAPPVDVVITDLNFHGQEEDGLVFIQWAQQNDLTAAIIVLSGDQDLKRVMSARNRIQDDFVVKPFELSELICAIEKARQRLADLKARPVRSVRAILTQDRRIQDAMKSARKVMESDRNICLCIYGEPGVGKEEFAKFAASIRGGPFIATNVGALPKDLVESELFGHLKGAFSGAIFNKKGLFEAANGGTIFLDEIGDASPPVQVRFLRVLQEREVSPVGSTSTSKVDVKVICATNKPLDQMVLSGEFREDLKGRIEGVVVVIPPLRERVGDIPLLVGKFLRDRSPKYREVATITAAALSALERYSWPGNVRELSNVVDAALLAADGREIGLEHLPEKVRSGVDPAEVDVALANASLNEGGDFDFARQVESFERKVISRAISKAKGSKIEARRLLNLKKSTFFRKLSSLGLE